MSVLRSVAARAATFARLGGGAWLGTKLADGGRSGRQHFIQAIVGLVQRPGIGAPATESKTTHARRPRLSQRIPARVPRHRFGLVSSPRCGFPASAPVRAGAGGAWPRRQLRQLSAVPPEIAPAGQLAVDAFLLQPQCLHAGFDSSQSFLEHGGNQPRRGSPHNGSKLLHSWGPGFSPSSSAPAQPDRLSGMASAARRLTVSFCLGQGSRGGFSIRAAVTGVRRVGGTAARPLVAGFPAAFGTLREARGKITPFPPRPASAFHPGKPAD